MDISRTPRLILERPALDLRYRHFERQKHGMHIIGAWLRDETGDYDPCIVLLHASRPIVPGRTTPCIIPLREAWRWAAHGDVGDPSHVARVVNDWIASGALPGNVWIKRDRLAVLDAVNENLPDLFTMPPRPVFDLRVIAEVSAKMTMPDGKTTSIEREVKDDA